MRGEPGFFDVDFDVDERLRRRRIVARALSNERAESQGLEGLAGGTRQAAQKDGDAR